VVELDQKVKSLVDDFGRALEQQQRRASAALDTAREAALAEAAAEHERRMMQLMGEMVQKEQAAALALVRAEEKLSVEREQRSEDRRSLHASLLLAQAEAEEAHDAAKAAVSQVLLSNAELARVVNVRLPQAVEEVRRHGARAACKCSPWRPTP
jgi:DNA-binding MarR family transcriptional regulator